MSTKIYNAWRVNSAVWNVMLKDLHAKYVQVMAEIICRRIDQSYQLPNESRRQKYFRLWFGILDLEYSQFRDDWQKGFKSGLIAFYHEGWFYFYPYGNLPPTNDPRSWFDELFSHPAYQDGMIKEFSYWDNVEEPEGLAEGEWNKRRDIWNAILEQEKPCRMVCEMIYWGDMWTSVAAWNEAQRLAGINEPVG